MSGLSAPTPSLGAFTGAPTPGVAPFGNWSPGSPDWELPDDWIHDAALSQFQKKLRIKIEGTRTEQYLDGKYEHKRGTIVGGQKAAVGFDSTAMVQFDDGESRSILAKYIVPVLPEKGQVALVLHGPDKGKAVTVQQIDGRNVTGMTIETNSWKDYNLEDFCVITWP